MKKSIFTRIISVMLICMMMIGSMAALTVSAEETESAAPTVEIVSNNVYYKETLNLMYAVKATGMTEGQTLRVVLCDADGNIKSTATTEKQLSEKDYEKLGDNTLRAFVVDEGVPAQDIATVVYAKAQILEGETVVAESEVQAYSVLEYLWERLTVSANVTEAQKNMYNALLTYAAAADVALNGVEESAISTSSYVAVVEEGKVISGGMYQVGDVVELTTALVPGENEKLIWNVTVNGNTTPYEAADLANGYPVVKGATVISAEVVVEVEPTTVTVSIADYAAANGWFNGEQYNTIALDNNITATAIRTTNNYNNTGKYYTSGNEWRCYQTDGGTVTITAENGKTIVSVKITYNIGNTGTLTLDGKNIASGTVVTVNANSITFGVGNTGSATNGQAKITAIEVVYE